MPLIRKEIKDMEKNTNKQEEPTERYLHRMRCKNMGYEEICYKHSGSFPVLGGCGHITLRCNGKCRRMTIWDNKNGYKGVEFKLRELL